jgi:hypothetical protein
MCDAIVKPSTGVADRLRPCTNNFEGSNLNDLIAVPTPVPRPARGAMNRRCREGDWYYAKLR